METVAAAAAAAGLSVRRAYHWLARYRAPVPADRISAIERLRRTRMSGPAIARRLAMPRSTVGAVLRRLGLGRLAALEPKPPVQRYQRARPGELIHIDVKKLGRIGGVLVEVPVMLSVVHLTNRTRDWYERRR